ncbi:MAG TPA: peroxidase-related enzyme [Thermoleophilaceae bacterium]|nr:peroxidase-related enzyme [Thermoleophilaceae bacterium]
MALAYIAAVEDDATLDAVQQDVFEAARRRFTFVPDVVRVLARRPLVAKAQSELRDQLLSDELSIGRRRAELISLAVSGINDCAYCGTAHAGTMVARGDLSAEQAAQAFKDWRALDLSREDRAMLEFAEKLTFQPAQVGEKDIAALREAGFGDLAIYDIVLVTAYRNFINRVNDGLGVSTHKLRTRFGDELADRIASEA